MWIPWGGGLPTALFWTEVRFLQRMGLSMTVSSLTSFVESSLGGETIYPVPRAGVCWLLALQL